MPSRQDPVANRQSPVSRIDAHQHFWKYDRVRDSWITDEMKILKGDFFPEDLSPILRQNKIDGCVSVQADQSEMETEFLLGLANRYPFVRGVVGWVDLCLDNINERLDYFSRFKLIKGFRHILQTAPAGFMKGKDFQNGISELEKRRFTYDVLIYYHQLPEAVEFVKRFPYQKFAIDHLAKPAIKDNEFDTWSKGMKQLASFENVSCKISGFTTEANWKTWIARDFNPYFDFVLEYFGARRLLYGSDWPVCLNASTYQSQLKLVDDFISKLSLSEKQQIMGGNAIDFYNL